MPGHRLRPHGTPSQHARATEHLSYEEIPTRCDEWALCVFPGATGPVFVVAYRADMDAHLREAQVDWDQGVELLRASGLTIGLDAGGFAHIRYATAEDRQQAGDARRIVREARERSGEWSA